jgi:two-component system, OmpR family, sensor histidine kinase MprB
MSLRRRLALLSALGIAVVLIAGGVATYVIERHQLRGQVDANLAKLSRGNFVFVGADAAGTRGDGTRPATSTRRLDEPSKGTLVGLPPKFGTLPVYVANVDARGKQTTSIGGVPLPVPSQARTIARRGEGRYSADVHVRGVHLRMLVAPAAGKGHALLIAQSLAETDRALSRLAWTLVITGLAGILLAAVVGAAVARGALRPVRRLTEAAERVAETRDLGGRIGVAGDDELSRLAKTFDTMLDSLERAVRSQRQLVADASHELRTPLASLRTNIDVLRQGTQLHERDRERLLRDVGDEIDELTTLVANLVELARGSHRDLHLQQVALDEIADRVVRRAQSRFPAHCFVLAADATTIWGDREEVERAVWNLIENAAKWSQRGGQVHVDVAGGEVSVRDFGPGVAASDRPHVFDRFYRSDAARGQPGSGLGLAIVRQVAESHGGRVEVDEAPGGGARFRVTFLETA